MVRIIPDQSIVLSSAGSEAEGKALNFLKILPDEYYVLRECKFPPSRAKQASGSQEDRSDLILIGPRLGVVILEVKDWALREGKFQFINQYEVLMTNVKTNTSKKIKNPWAQADEYLHAICESLKRMTAQNGLWVSSFVVYPKLSRADFENTFVGSTSRNPQEQFTLDLSKALFQEDFRPTDIPLLNSLERLVKRSSVRRLPQEYSTEQVEATVSWLVPSEMRVGGLSDVGEASRKFALLDDEQQKWAFSNALDQKIYLADVAGSGKTNVLLSRAIYWAKQHRDKGGCRILVTTYSAALEYELHRIFNAKIRYDPDLSYYYYKKCISIINVITLMESIVQENKQATFARWKTQAIEKYTEENYLEDKLPVECITLLEAGNWKSEQFDYLLIDEIQDFNTWFLEVTMCLLKDRDNLFTVGDIGQKLFDRDIEWGSFDIILQRVSLKSKFLMYRSPQPIAKLAWKFLTTNRFIASALKEEGYQDDIKPKSPFHTRPVLLGYDSEEELLDEISTHIQSYWQTARPEQILCVGLKDGLLQQLHARLVQATIPVRWASEEDAVTGKYVLLASYVEAKGLERDYVFIVDADRLALKKNIFISAEESKLTDMRDRIKLFVALTRAIQEVRLYYIDQCHVFISDLLHLQSGGR